VALIIVLFAILLFSVLAASTIFVTQTQIWTNLSYRLTTQARYAAEAGIERTMNWMMNSYTPPSSFASYDTTKYPVQYNSQPVVLSAVSGVSANYPDATVQTTFNTALGSQSIPGIPNATFSTYATLLRMSPGPGVSWLGSSGSGKLPQTWQVTSIGSIGNIRSAIVQLQATYERLATPIFAYAVAATGPGCSSISISGSTFTDSFNSSQGYAATHQDSGGNVATNGNMSMSGSAQIRGTFSGLNTITGSCPPNGITNSSSASPIDSGTLRLSSALSYSSPLSPSPSPPTTDYTLPGDCGSVPAGCTHPSSNNVVLSPNYQYGDLTLSGGSSVMRLSVGTYIMNSLTLSGGSTLVLDSVPVILDIAATGDPSALDLSGGSVSNPSGIPSNFQVVYAGTATIKLSGGSGSYAVVYAPNSPVTMSGSSDWYGAVICNTLTDNGGAAIHYDNALQNSVMQVGPMKSVGFSWSKF
jgi:hypothetical protein